MKYAVEIANAGSMNKASEQLYIAQPNLSRAIKELEADLGITIFRRSPKGITITPEGEEFIGYAKKILSEIDEVEYMYKHRFEVKHKFSISVPRACYISDAFANFSKQLLKKDTEVFYHETNSLNAINNILQADYKLAIIRYAEKYDKYFKSMFESKGLKSEKVAEFKYSLIMNKKCPIANKPEINVSDLNDYIEITRADQFVPSLPLSTVKQEEFDKNISRRIFVFERASQFDLLSKNTQTFMWVSLVPDHVLERYDLVNRVSENDRPVYKDVLVYKQDYVLSDLDNAFIEEIKKAIERYKKF
jgi:DNA-binding transcriptional LysR family regulator